MIQKISPEAPPAENNLPAIRTMLKKAGTNRRLRSKTIHLEFTGPWQILANFLAQSAAAPLAFSLCENALPPLNPESLVWSQLLNAARTFFEQNPD